MEEELGDRFLHGKLEHRPEYFHFIYDNLHVVYTSVSESAAIYPLQR
jgi:hypothetical protein